MNDANLHRQATHYRLVLTAILLVGGGALILEHARRAGAGAGNGELLTAIPSLIYLVAVWRLRQAAVEVARGEPFAPRAAAAMRGVGVLLLIGAAIALMLPLIQARLLGQPLARWIDADIATLAIAAVGVGQILVGRLLRRAGKTERELSEFF